jgi:hypothetical protein
LPLRDLGMQVLGGGVVVDGLVVDGLGVDVLGVDVLGRGLVFVGPDVVVLGTEVRLVVGAVVRGLLEVGSDSVDVACEGSGTVGCAPGSGEPLPQAARPRPTTTAATANQLVPGRRVPMVPSPPLTSGLQTHPVG